MNKKKLILILAPLLLLVVAAAGWMFLKPASAGGDPATEPGPVHTLADPFVVNLADSTDIPRFVKVGVALRLAVESESRHTPGTPTAPGVVEGEAQVRDIVISALQGRTSTVLGTERGRDGLKREIVRRVNADTDLTILDVYYTDFAVQ